MFIRITLFGIWAACLAFSAQAQVSVGASIGANYSFWGWHVKNPLLDVGYTEDPGFGYRAAAVADWQISPVIGLRADLAYQIWRNSTALVLQFPRDSAGQIPPTVRGKSSERFHNFAGSLLACISPFRQKHIYFLAGVTATSITEAWFTITIEDDGPFPGGYTSSTSIDLKNYNRTQVFADFGGGVKFPLGAKGSLFSEIRYQLPLTNLWGSDNVDASVSPLLLNVGYLFQL